MKKTKILALALAGALACPQVAFAAEDSTGMRYDSASEGLYGSLRAIYRSKAGNEDANNAIIEADSSRFGFRGTADMGGGLTGLYHYEQNIVGQDGEVAGNVRLNYVGLRGNFGEVNVGGTNNNIYSMAYSYADGSISGGGNYYDNGSRLKNAITYTSPLLNGFQGGVYLQLDGGSENPASTSAKLNFVNTTGNALAVAVQPGLTVNVAARTGNPLGANVTVSYDVTTRAENENVDRWGLGATYAVRGFKVGGGYEVRPSGFNGVHAVFAPTDTNSAVAISVNAQPEDRTSWHLAGQYGQDNWKVAAVYGNTNYSDSPYQTIGANATFRACGKGMVASGAVNLKGCEDETRFAVLGSIDVGKVGMRVELNNHSAYSGIDGIDRQLVSFGGEYRFTAQTKVYGAYIARDYDDDATVADSVVIGMRVDF